MPSSIDARSSRTRSTQPEHSQLPPRRDQAHAPEGPPQSAQTTRTQRSKQKRPTWKKYEKASWKRPFPKTRLASESANKSRKQTRRATKSASTLRITCYEVSRVKSTSQTFPHRHE